MNVSVKTDLRYCESIPVNLLRQFLFCPRIPYYQFLMGFTGKETLWMRQGNSFQERIEKLLKRRTLARFGLENAEICYSVHLHCDTLKIHGIADCLLIAESEVVPLEFKLGHPQVRRSHKIQLFAYGSMAAKKLNKEFKRGFLLYGQEAKNLLQIENSAENFSDLRETVEKLHTSLALMLKPDSSASSSQCGQCEYLTHCNDREL